jgi:transcription elongation GreA/GreB family factor
MTKNDIHRRFIDLLASELESLTAAAKNSASMATNEAHRAESKYDTFSLESSYLARGQAKRIEELTFALQRLQALSLSEQNGTTPIRLSALVRLASDNGGKRTLFFGPAAGGEKIIADGEEVVIVTARSPLGQALVGKTVGNTFDFKIGTVTHTFTVTSVE